MPPEPPRLRPARREDAPDLARLVDLASEGLASYLWAEIAEPGEAPFDVGVRRAERDAGAFSWRNAVIAELGGAVAGGLVTYGIGEAPEPPEEQPPMFRPLQALENRALGTLYVNVLATYPALRGRGVGSRLLAEAERQAGRRNLSLIVADRNLTARRLYEAFGFVEIAREPMVKDGWATASDAWVLMVRDAGASRRSS
jgi:ribosomal protein S18 acetylase RimI-like enzyme